MEKIIFTILLFFAVVNKLYSQTSNELLHYSKGITPMHKFFQQYADSTIIIEYASGGYDPPAYKIICHKDSFVNTFSYRAIDTTWKTMGSIKKKSPVILWYNLSAKKILFKNTPADINIFFNVVSVNPDTAKKIWNTIAKYKPWKIVDDSSFGRGCKGIPDEFVHDGGSPDIIHLITKKEIKTLIFWYPDYYEKRCPGNKNRQAISAIDDIFYCYFPKFKNQY